MTWKSKFFGNVILSEEGQEHTEEVLAGKKFIGVYFSAQWCPPCRGFTPMLISIYNNIVDEDDGQIEIVFVSSDQDDEGFEEYFEEMPWMALQYEDEEKRFEMSSFFNVNGIPAFMILDGETGNVVTTNGRNDIQACNGDHSVLFEAWNGKEGTPLSEFGKKEEGEEDGEGGEEGEEGGEEQECVIS